MEIKAVDLILVSVNWKVSFNLRPKWAFPTIEHINLIKDMTTRKSKASSTLIQGHKEESLSHDGSKSKEKNINFYTIVHV